MTQKVVFESSKKHPTHPCNFWYTSVRRRINRTSFQVTCIGLSSTFSPLTICSSQRPRNNFTAMLVIDWKKHRFLFTVFKQRSTLKATVFPLSYQIKARMWEELEETDTHAVLCIPLPLFTNLKLVGKEKKNAQIFNSNHTPISWELWRLDSTSSEGVWSWENVTPRLLLFDRNIRPFINGREMK